jgi:hypothetical protein
LQSAADSAALAAASALVNKGITIDQAKTLATKFISGQMSNYLETDANNKKKAFDFASCTTVTIVQTNMTGNAKKYDVKVSTCYKVDYSTLSLFLGKSGGTLTVTSSTESTTESKNALSMYMVLDRSGSMDEYTDTVSGSYTCRYGRKTYTCYTYYTKIAALKIAATNLMTTLGTADPTATLVRTGAASYNSAMQTPTNLAWGETKVNAYVNALTATGGTDSSIAFKTAYQALSSSTEDAAHANVNGKVPSKYIIFMTDGDNNYTTADTATKQWCDAARNAGIEVFTIAFMAPTNGKQLLSYCATTSAHYFAAENADDLYAAFKYIGEKATAASTLLTQ